MQADGAFEITGVLPGSYQIFFSKENEEASLASGKLSGGGVAGAEAGDAGCRRVCGGKMSGGVWLRDFAAWRGAVREYIRSDL